MYVTKILPWIFRDSGTVGRTSETFDVETMVTIGRSDENDLKAVCFGSGVV